MSLHTAVKGQFGLGTGRAMGKALKKATPLTMFLGRVYRHQKRKVLLSLVHTPQKTPSSMNRWSPPAHDARGIERQWYECVWRSHAACCGCGDFVGHINDLAHRFGRPPGSRPPTTPQPPAVRALPALPAPEPWSGAGGDAGAGGDGAAGRGGGDGDAGDVADEDLLDAVDLAE